MNRKEIELDKYLTEDERKRLIELRRLAEESRGAIEEQYNPLNMSVRQLIQRWVLIHQLIIREFVELTSNFQSKYSIYFQDIDQSKQWFQGVMMVFRDVAGILSKEDRGIYVGITLILISLWLYTLYLSE